MLRKNLCSLCFASLLFTAFAVSACKSSGDEQAQLKAPDAPQYDNAFAELKDLDNRIKTQIEWVKQPIADADSLAQEIASTRERLNLDAAKFNAVINASFSGGTVELGEDLHLDETSKAEVEVLIVKSRDLGKALQSVSSRVRIAEGNFNKINLKLPNLSARATSYLKSQASQVAPEARADFDAQIKEVPSLADGVKTSIPGAMDQVRAVPDEAASATTRFRGVLNAG